FAFHLPERDGILSALILLESLATERRSLEQALAALTEEFGELFYARRDLYLPVEIIQAYLEAARRDPPVSIGRESVKDVRDPDGIKYVRGRRGWLLQRLSGTEPMIRIYCEHQEAGRVEQILSEAVERLTLFAGERGAQLRLEP